MDQAPPRGTLAERMLAALLAAASDRAMTALVGNAEPTLGVVVFPELGAGVALVERAGDAGAVLEARLAAILRGHANGVLHLVLVDGRPEDRATLRAADRTAHDPNRLGVHMLDGAGRVTRIAGRRFPLLRAAAARLHEARPLGGDELVEHNKRVQTARQGEAALASAIERRPHWAIRVLGGICIAMFALTLLWGRRSFDLALQTMGANKEALVRAGEVWRLLAYAFLHGNGGHLLLNLIGLFSLGGFLEGLLGWRRIVVLYAVAALAGGIASAFIGHAPGGSVGASGALWGLMTAAFGIVLRRSPLIGAISARYMRNRMLVVLALNVAFSFVPHVDLWAHAGGGLAGFALAMPGFLTHGLVPGQSPNDHDRARRGWHLGALAAILIMAASVAAALLTGKPWQPQVLLGPDQFART
jgi:rhomboid protease GluP